MRVLLLVRATEDSEAGVMPSTELLEAMGEYNEELANAGIHLAGEVCSRWRRASAWPPTAHNTPSSTALR